MKNRNYENILPQTCIQRTLPIDVTLMACLLPSWTNRKNRPRMPLGQSENQFATLELRPPPETAGEEI